MENTIDLFIVQSDSPNANIAKTIGCFAGHLGVAVHEVPNLDRISVIVGDFDWYGVLYDNEVLDPLLARYIQLHFNSGHDVIKCIKKRRDPETGETKHSEAPRFFKRSVRLKPGCLLPDDMESISIDRAIDGWILEHDYAQGKI